MGSDLEVKGSAMYASALTSSVEACLSKRHSRCLVNSHDGICGESVFEMETAGCWLFGISVSGWLQPGSCQPDIYPSGQLPCVSFVATFDVTPAIFM